MYPHFLLERYLADHLGRRSDLYGPLADDLFIPLVRSVSDQLSIYCDVRPCASLITHAVRLRDGAERSYVLAPITDRGQPLRIQGVVEHWEIPQPSDEAELVEMVNGRRWRFIDRHLGRFMGPLLTRIADALGEFYQRKPHAVPKAGIIRLCEGVDETWLVLEVDDRSTQTPKDAPTRYSVQ